MERLTGLALLHPWRVLAATLVVLALCVPGLMRLRIAVDGRALLPQDEAAVRLSHEIQQQFDVDDQIAVVYVAPPPGVFTPVALEQLSALSSALAALPGVGPVHVTSLATEPGDTVRPGTLDFLPWLDPLPTSQALADARARSMQRASIYRGTLLSLDTPPTASALLVDVGSAVDRAALCRDVRRVARGFERDGARVLVVGAPYAEEILGEHLLGDLARLVPISLCVMALLFFLAFGATAAVVLPLMGVGAAIVVTFGTMGWCGVPLRLTTLVLPVLLTAIGIAYAIHVFDHLRAELLARPAGERLAALRATLGELARPIATTSITTAIGFGSFALSPIPAVAEFGLFLAVGTLACLAWTLLALPAVLAVGGEWLFHPRPGQGRSRFAQHFAALLERATLLLARRSGMVIAATFAAVLGCAWLATRVRVQDSWIDGFDPHSEVVRSTAEVERSFGGTHVLRLRVRAEVEQLSAVVPRAEFDGQSVRLTRPPGLAPEALVDHLVHITSRREPDASAPVELRVLAATATPDKLRLELVHPGLAGAQIPELLPPGDELAVEVRSTGRLRQLRSVRALEALETHLRQLDGVGAVIGPWGHLLSLHQLLSNDPDKEHLLLGTQVGLERSFNLYTRARGEHRLHQVWNPTFDAGLVTLLVRGANYERVARLIEDLRAYEREQLAPFGLHLDLAGDLAESQTMITAIVSTQVLSLAATLLLIVLCLVVSTRSWRIALACILPGTLGTLTIFALMGAASLPLGVATSMFGAMAIGLGDDHAIHWLERLRLARARGLAGAQACGRAAREAGPSIVLDALAVGAGFGVLMFSSVPTNARLGLLLVASCLACLAWTLILLPALFGRGSGAAGRVDQAPRAARDEALSDVLS